MGTLPIPRCRYTFFILKRPLNDRDDMARSPKVLDPTVFYSQQSEIVGVAKLFLICWLKMLGPTDFYSQQSKSVGVGATFSHLLELLFLICWTHFFSFVGHTFSN